jgi:uncharacterized protein YdaU (DUF1376 family)
MKDRPSYLPLYVRDWRSDAKVLLLPWDERALYLDMLMLSWELGPLPLDAQRIRTALGCPHVVTSIVTILVTFFVEGPDGWTNARLEKERAHWAALHEANKTRLEAANTARMAKRSRDDSRDDSRDEVHDDPRNGFQAQAQAQAQKKNQSPERAHAREGGINPPREARNGKVSVVPWNGQVPQALRGGPFERAWADWLKYKHERGQAVTQLSGDKAIAILVDAGVTAAVAAIDEAIAKGYTGFVLRQEEGDKIVSYGEHGKACVLCRAEGVSLQYTQRGSICLTCASLSQGKRLAGSALPRGVS